MIVLAYPNVAIPAHDTREVVVDSPVGFTKLTVSASPYFAILKFDIGLDKHFDGSNSNTLLRGELLTRGIVLYHNPSRQYGPGIIISTVFYNLDRNSFHGLECLLTVE